MPDLYDILEHGQMVGDRRRLEAYFDAIGRTVRPGSVVVDIGSGTGVFAVAACQAGAARVYAIEPSDVVTLAREIALANGYASRIEFIPRFSTEVTLPERADVVVLDVRGVLPDEQIPVAADARRRFLREGGAIIPATDTLWVAPVSAPELHTRHVGRWLHDSSGIDLRPVCDWAASRSYKCRVRGDELIADPRMIGTVDYRAVESPDVRGAADWIMRAPGTTHGLVAWFDSVLCDDVTLSNRPGAPALLYGNAYLPLREPTALRTGDRMSATLSGRSHGDSYVWEWSSAVVHASSVLT